MRALRVLLLALSVTLVAAGANAGKLAVSASAKPVKVKRQAKRVKRPAQRPTRKLSPKRRSSQLRRSLQRKQVHRRVQPRKVKRGARGSGKGLVFRTGKLKRDVDLVIFDLDGTVAETRQDIATNFNAGFKSIGVEVPMNKLLKLVDGSPLEKTYWA
ncbi:MAG: hypothetical protein KJO07_00995, partial [Deltaproteobacteria bacterium]|nr:hypothetical protein [Deltaproteobacteria bacterium]